MKNENLGSCNCDSAGSDIRNGRYGSRVFAADAGKNVMSSEAKYGEGTLGGYPPNRRVKERRRPPATERNLLMEFQDFYQMCTEEEATMMVDQFFDERKTP